MTTTRYSQTLFRNMALGLVVVLTMIAAAPAGDKRPTIRVGSKDFTESMIVGELYALALEREGFDVKRVFAVANAIVHTAILNNEIDVYPEYTGTGLLTILRMELRTDPDDVYNTVKDEYAKQFSLTWLDRSQANDGQGLVIRTETAKRLGIKNISDLQHHAGEIRFASQGEFDHRDDGLPRMISVYGPFKWKSSRVYDNGLKYQILKNNQADLAPAYTTEGQLVDTASFTLLEDDKQMWPPYHLAPVVRTEVLEAHPAIAPALNRVSAALDTETITRLNAAVDVDKREYEDVAREFFATMK